VPPVREWEGWPYLEAPAFAKVEKESVDATGAAASGWRSERMIGRERRRDSGAILFGVLLLFVGGYYVLRNTLGFDLGELDGERIWPIAVVIIGVMIPIRAVDRSSPEHRGM
jgi:hypothetical protein